MNSLFKLLSISTISITLTSALPLKAEAVNNQSHSVRSIPANIERSEFRQRENMEREDNPRRHIDEEFSQKLDRERFDREKSNKYIFGEGKELKNFIKPDNAISSEQKVNNTTPNIPLNAQQERAAYIQDFHWKSSAPANNKTTVAIANTNSANKATRVIMDNKKDNKESNKKQTLFETHRREANDLLYRMQKRMHDRERSYTNQDWRDPYRNSLFQRIRYDIRKSYHDIEESRIHPDQVEKNIAMLEEDLRLLARDEAELAQYDRSHPMNGSSMARSNMRVSKK